jgi:hypothetical protein
LRYAASTASAFRFSDRRIRRVAVPIVRSRTKNFSFSLRSSCRVTLTDSTPRSTVTSIESGSMPGTSSRSTTSPSRRTPSSGMVAAWPNVCRASRSS